MDILQKELNTLYASQHLEREHLDEAMLVTSSPTRRPIRASSMPAHWPACWGFQYPHSEQTLPKHLGEA